MVRVRWSSLNYKDALSATGHPGVTRNFPHTPGIDAAGEVVSDASGRFQPGDAGDRHRLRPRHGDRWRLRPADPHSGRWALPLPPVSSLRDAMVLGTAGLTAALSVHALVEHGIAPEAGEILVTGATGGVGSVAVALLGPARLPGGGRNRQPKQAELPERTRRCTWCCRATR